MKKIRIEIAIYVKGRRISEWVHTVDAQDWVENKEQCLETINEEIENLLEGGEYDLRGV